MLYSFDTKGHKCQEIGNIRAFYWEDKCWEWIITSKEARLWECNQWQEVRAKQKVNPEFFIKKAEIIGWDFVRACLQREDNYVISENKAQLSGPEDACSLRAEPRWPPYLRSNPAQMFYILPGGFSHSSLR